MTKVWERKGYTVQEVEFDGDLHHFEVIQSVNGGAVHIATIEPETIDDMKEIIADLDAGEDVNGWEDGNGNTISIEVEEEMDAIETVYAELEKDGLQMAAGTHLEYQDGGTLIYVCNDDAESSDDYIMYESYGPYEILDYLRREKLTEQA